jgi:SNF2 family DNA or RNA helicase
MVLSTVLLNPLKENTPLSEASGGLFIAKSTVIITPTTILYQWVNELKHAPNLTYLIYDGQAEDEDGIEVDQAYIAQYDIIFTTYQFLQKEFYNALPPPTRPRRSEQKYVRKPSIFRDTYFYRVVLDEAQMVERIHSNSTTMAGMIKREISWGVTGTPCPKTGSLHDMQGLFDFIKSSFSSTGATSLYDCLPEPIISKALESFTHRNTKHNVERELSLPEQRDTAFNLHLNAIEDQFYNDSLDYALEKIPEKPVIPDDPTDKKLMNLCRNQVSARLKSMQTSFIALRKICCHPRIGSTDRKSGKAETMQDVVESMLQRTIADLHSSGRQLVTNHVHEGQLCE